MSSKLVNLGTHDQNNLVDCQPKGFPERLMEETPQADCNRESQINDWIDNLNNKNVGLGNPNFCDPMQTGQIVDDLDMPNRNVVYRYSKAIRACDEAVMGLFKNLVVIDNDGKAHAVPIIWATQEKAVLFQMAENVRKDESLVVDRIKLPMMAIYSNSFQFNQERYIYHKATDYLRYM